MADACSNPPDAEGVYKMLAKNFERHYNSNRAPFGMYYHAAWFTQGHHKEGKFLGVASRSNRAPEPPKGGCGTRILRSAVAAWPAIKKDRLGRRKLPARAPDIHRSLLPPHSGFNGIDVRRLRRFLLMLYRRRRARVPALAGLVALDLRYGAARDKIGRASCRERV